ncbi:hypothetical protein Tco_1072856 [Tanacetum coccineum]
MKRGYAGEHVPLLPAMLAGAAEDQGEGSTNPAEPTPTPVDGPTFIHVADEATTIGVGVGTKGATTTTTGLDAGLDSGNIHESPLPSNEVPLNEGHTSRSAEDSMILQDLIVKEKVERKSLALKAKKESSDEECSTSGSEDEEYAMAVRDFKKFFKRRENALDASDSGEEDDEKVKDETCLVDHASSEVCSESSYFSDENSSIDDIALDNEYDKLCKMSLKIITKNKRLKATRNSLENELKELKDKLSILEKNKGVDLDCAKCHTLKIENENLKEESTRLNKFEKSTYCLNEMLSNQKPSSDKLEQQKKRKVEVQEAAQYYTEEDWIPSEQNLKQMQTTKCTRIKAQQRDYMSTFIKNQSSWKLTQLKKLTFDELKTKFEKLVKSIENFVPMETDKRVKRQEPVIAKEEEIEKSDESEEEREAFMKDKVTSASSESKIGIDAIPTAQKPLSFEPYLKTFQRDDLIELYRLVIKKYGVNRPEEIYDRVLWGDLKTMFDPPLSDDAIWGLPLKQKMIN